MRTGLATLLLVAGCTGASLAIAQTDRTVEIRGAAEVEFETERHRLHQLQGSTNLIDWHNVGEAEYGSGRRRRHLTSTRHAEHHYYRLVSVESTNLAVAPWSFAGLSIQLDDDAHPQRLDFLTEGQGQEVHATDADPFTYELTKTGDNEARTDLWFEHGKSNVWFFSFAATNRGTFVRERYDRGRLKDRDLGMFRLVAVDTNAPVGGTASQPPAPPASLSHRVFYFQVGGDFDRVQFDSATTGVQADGCERQGDDRARSTFDYSYQVVNSNAATLVLRFAGEVSGRDEHAYELTFTDGESGRCVRREYRQGQLRDTRSGVFSPLGPSTPSGGTNQPPADTNIPPASIVGERYTMLSGVIPEELTFRTDTTGVQLDDSAPSDFTYHYSVSGPAQARLLVTFKTDKWDAYDLTYTDAGGGLFTRQEYREGVLKDTDSGPFTRSAAP